MTTDQTDEPLFAVRGLRMHPTALWGAALLPGLFLLLQIYLNVVVRQHLGYAALMVVTLAFLAVALWLRFGRCSFTLFEDRIELWISLDPFLPRGRSVIPLANLKRVTLRGFNLRLYTDTDSCVRDVFTLPLARVVSEDFLDRLELLAEERELELRFEEDGAKRTVQRTRS